MKHVQRILPFALAALVLAVALPVHPAAAAKSTSTASTAKKKGAALHQFSGTVTALDKSSLTVEKGGKQAKTMVFEKHAEMRTTGDLEKDARVTVWYRDEDGHSVAHRVVVKGATATASR